MAPDPLVGTARANITPDWPVMLAGFGQRTRPATEVHDPVFGKALYLEDQAERMLIVTTDLLSIPHQVGAAVTGAIAAATGLVARQVCICASHTHSAPMPGYLGDGATGVERYEAFLIQALTALGIAALKAARPCRLRCGIGQSDIFFNRRTHGNPNRVDRRVAVVVADDAASGQPHAVLFGAGCHPTVMGWDNMSISADFTGFAQAAIERAWPHATALFFNTAQGNIVPITSPRFDALDPRGYRGGNWATAQGLGEMLAAAVLRAAATAEPAAPALASRRRDLALLPYFGRMDHAAAAVELAGHRRIVAGELGADFETAFPAGQLWSHSSRLVIEADMDEPRMRRLMIACCYSRALIARLRMSAEPPAFQVPVQVLHLAGFTFLALPGEVLTESGAEWSALAGGERAFIIALANSHHRYLPGRVHFDEPDAVNRYETASAGLETVSMDRCFDAAAEMHADIAAR